MNFHWSSHLLSSCVIFLQQVLYTITLNKDGTFTERINSHGVDESTGHWVKEGDIYKLNYDENYTFEATIENGQMTFNSYGEIFVLKK